MYKFIAESVYRVLLGEKMSKCDADILIRRAGGLSNSWYKCQLEKDHKGKHRFEGRSEGKLFRVE